MQLIDLCYIDILYLILHVHCRHYKLLDNGKATTKKSWKVNQKAVAHNHLSFHLLWTDLLGLEHNKKGKTSEGKTETVDDDARNSESLDILSCQS